MVDHAAQGCLVVKELVRVNIPEAKCHRFGYADQNSLWSSVLFFISGHMMNIFLIDAVAIVVLFSDSGESLR